MRLLLAIITALTLASCSSTNKLSDAGAAGDVVPAVNNGEYIKLIERYTKSDKRYSGLHLAYEADVTMLNSEVRVAMVQRQTHFLQWNMDKARQEREEAIRNLSTYSTFFFSFFTPDNQHNDLTETDSIWEIYLEVNGTRYEGKTEKVAQKLIELEALFPHHDRWSTAYRITFNVPMTSIQQARSTVVITSSLGESRFVFSPVLNSASIY